MEMKVTIFLNCALSSLPSAGAARRPTNHVVALNHVSSEGGPLRFLNQAGSLVEGIGGGSVMRRHKFFNEFELYKSEGERR